MKSRLVVFAALIACIGFSSVSCTKMSVGVPPAPNTTYLKGADGPPLYLIDNVVISNPKQAQIDLNLNPNDIKSIDVLSPGRDNKLVDLYGPKARNGVILITTKGSK